MDPNDTKIGFKKRILPVSTIAIMLFYVVDWIQPAEHHDCTTSLALLAIAVSGFLIAVFFSFEMLNFKVPVLSEMGKNLLVLFIFALVFSLLAQFLVDDFRDVLNTTLFNFHLHFLQQWIAHQHTVLTVNKCLKIRCK